MTAYDDGRVSVHLGDCLDVLRSLPDASVDAVVTDPPYGLEFMGKEWDAPWKDNGRWVTGDSTFDERPKGGTSPFEGRSRPVFSAGKPFQDWCELWAAECLRVLKPGGHMLAFGGTRTWHRLACAVEDAGFEVRDSLAWVYGSGFPKSLNVGKAIDMHLQPGVPREDVKETPEGSRWRGHGTALKPAFEPVVVARKPLQGTVAANVLAHGTGALNVDGCRVDAGGENLGRPTGSGAFGIINDDGWVPTLERTTGNPAGRWPANVVLDESQAQALDQMSGESVTPKKVTRGASKSGRDGATARSGGAMERRDDVPCHGDSGGASRFFKVAREDEPCTRNVGDAGMEWTSTRTAEKADAADPIVNATSPRFMYTPKAPKRERPRSEDGTAHPTVKPLDLMRWLVRLVTPPGGLVLDPFAGSGTTVEACIVEGFRCLAIEREPDYLPLILQRINRQRDPLKHTRTTGGDLALFELDGESA